ncbi:MAG: hypothetical protein KF805_06580 [Phycisphaeraceae bacterium]|nr:hypothetical protein [Phycisphaeraceae bacterium]
MTKAIGLLVSLVLLASFVVAQIPNVNLANSIIGARQKNNALLVQYTWTAQTQITQYGNVKDTRIQQVSYGPGGVPQYVMLNDIGAPMPRGFFRRAIAENEKERMEKYLKGLGKLIDQYTLPSSGAVVNFLGSATITSATGPDGSQILQTTGSGVVTPGDSMTITFNSTTFNTKSVQMSSTFENQPVTMTATFRTLPSGLNHMQYATIEAPGEGIMVSVHNYDYVPNN